MNQATSLLRRGLADDSIEIGLQQDWAGLRFVGLGEYKLGWVSNYSPGSGVASAERVLIVTSDVAVRTRIESNNTTIF